jgi:hypothetical protein
VKPVLTSPARPINFAGPFAGDSVPPAARIDFDSASGRVLVAAKCLREYWCQFSLQGGRFGKNRFPHASRNVPGWYDEQYLAIPGATAGTLVPSKLRAYLFPIDTLAKLSAETHFGGWQHVATIAFDNAVTNADAAPALERYYAKWKLGRMPQTSDTIKIMLKYFPAAKRWRARFDLPTVIGREVENVHYMPAVVENAPFIAKLSQLNLRDAANMKKLAPHVGPIEVPGTARWGWDPLDETVWIRCAAGCCSVGDDD